MKIALLVPQGGYSFVNQARSLAKGLTELKVENCLIRISQDFPLEQIVDFKPNLIVGAGSWHEYEDFVVNLPVAALL
mgnify:CR=1 FL=1